MYLKLSEISTIDESVPHHNEDSNTNTIFFDVGNHNVSIMF